MDITITPKQLQGTIQIIPSKSQAHRVLICAAFSDNVTKIRCSQSNRDIDATVQCLQALGAKIVRTKEGFIVTPIRRIAKNATLPCCESGSTLRFLLPIVGALGIDTLFQVEGRLPERPLSPLWEEMERMGCTLSRPTKNSLRCAGKLRGGQYIIEGGVSSQFVTGLLIALPLIKGNCCISVRGKLESKPYVQLTQSVMKIFQVDTTDYKINGNGRFISPGNISIEGDWSNGAFFLAANALGSDLQVMNLNQSSAQGDRYIAELLPKLSQNISISAADIPDLIPILSIVAASKQGCTFTDIQRLRLKESDRVASVIQMLNALGIQATATEKKLTVFPGKFTSGIVDTVNDHRIAMSAAIAATIAEGPVRIMGAECVKKSYPTFWEEYARLGGTYE